MQEPKFRTQLKRRTLLLAGLQLTGLGVLTGRLVQLQFVQGDMYRTRAEGNRIKLQLTTPSRGQLLDRNGLRMAENLSDYRLILERENKAHTQETWDVLQTLFPFSKDKIDSVNAHLTKRGRSTIMLQERVEWDQVATLEFHRYRLPALRIEKGEQRHYVYGETAAHIIGYVRKLQEDDEEQDLLRKMPHIKVGREGCEHRFEEALRGRPGSQQLEVDAKGVVVRELTNTPSQAGEDITLTLDAELQKFCAERMQGESAACVVMHAHAGNLLTLASTPAFDPNQFARGFTHDYWQSLQNEKKPLLNKAMAGQYPPGSTFKMLVGLRALKEGIINPYTTKFCPGHYYLGNQRFNCWKAGGHGRVNVSQALIESCDTFFYEIANEMGIDAIAETARDFGLGERTRLGLIGEEEGLVPTPAWKQSVRNQSWSGGDTINASIGQGFVLATPLQLTQMMARLVNGGRMVTPRIHTLEADASPRFLPYSEEHLEVIRRALVRVVYNQEGTAHGSRPRGSAYSFGGKTGTSQVRRIIQRGQDQSRLPWNQRHHALFTAFAPVIDPQWVATILVEHGGGGAAAAAPIARDVMLKLQAIEEGKDGV